MHACNSATWQDDETPLMKAVRYNATENQSMIRFLLEKGADHTMVNEVRHCIRVIVCSR